jgi:hypothetical protein
MLQENLDDDISTFETYMLAGHGEVSPIKHPDTPKAAWN